ncbi:unnamed protein product [Vitrella brassicaformis CCMP3155]|uniref:Uncharacterized protein n=1 Tax=Vitrella brassicaformis (strain CCMP3155) TaxID=1169540 RepID=A0A0G4EPV0_VITBC|nr:unnamed protein product [Vitrella brassicaformis CCMP3155]|eukprot:CEL99466.1 unnamed protein product [Vitrella brassicaformis CCMP3155]
MGDSLDENFSLTDDKSSKISALARLLKRKRAAAATNTHGDGVARPKKATKKKRKSKEEADERTSSGVAPPQMGFKAFLRTLSPGDCRTPEDQQQLLERCIDGPPHTDNSEEAPGDEAAAKTKQHILAGVSFLDHSSLPPPPSSGHLPYIPLCVEAADIDLSSPQPPGGPGVMVLVLTHAAARAHDISQWISVHGLGKEGGDIGNAVRTALLCSYGGGRKKEQLDRHRDDILNPKTLVAVGVPGRVKRVLEQGVFRFRRGCSPLVLVDMQPNVKSMNLLTLPETRRDLVALLEVLTAERERAAGPLNLAFF